MDIKVIIDKALKRQRVCCKNKKVIKLRPATQVIKIKFQPSEESLRALYSA